MAKKTMNRSGNHSQASNRRTAVLYARVSSKQQEAEGFSIPAQLDLLRAYARDEEITVLREFQDVETAKQAGRTEFGEMVKLLRKTTTCRIVLVEKTDRLYRNMKDWVLIDELGLEIHFVKEGVVLSPESRSSEKFMHGIKVLMAKNFCDNLSEETKKGMLTKARQGIWPTYAPVGYVNADGLDGKRTIAPDPELGPIVTRLFETYASGKYSLKDVTVIARDLGLRYRKSGKPLPKSAIHLLLSTRTYSGAFDFVGVTYQGTYQPLVTPELWEHVQDVLHGRVGRKTRTVKSMFSFAGLIACGHCGCSLVADIKKGKYVYYRCSGAKGRCPERYTKEEELEKQFLAALKRLSFDEQVLTWVRLALFESHRDEKQFHAEAVEKLQRDRRRLQDRIETMYIDRLDGRIDAEFYDKKTAEFRSEQARLMREIQAHGTANQSYIADGVRLLELAQRAAALFEKQPPTEKRKLLGFLLSNCTWKDGELTVTYRQPFDILALTVASEQKRIGDGRPDQANFETWGG